MHAMVYEPTTGELKSMDVDFNAYLSELKDVYDIYNHDGDMMQRGDQERVFSCTPHCLLHCQPAL